jgi:hypothetical protein
VTVCNSCISGSKAEHFIKRLDRQRIKHYTQYWNTLKPKTHNAYFDMWLFAFMSIRTRWQANIEGFLAIKDIIHDCSFNSLLSAIKNSGTGLYTLRTRGLIEFRDKFWDAPEKFYPETDDMEPFRTHMAKTLFGIGMAKISFALELAYPDTCSVVCADTHILQLYGYTTQASPSVKQYKTLERHWLDVCNDYDVPSPMARHIYWDDNQGKTNTRYWSYVMETRN